MNNNSTLIKLIGDIGKSVQESNLPIKAFTLELDENECAAMINNENLNSSIEVDGIRCGFGHGGLIGCTIDI